MRLLLRIGGLALCAAVLIAAMVALRDDDGGSQPKRSGNIASTEPGKAIRDPEEDRSFPEPGSSDSHPVADSPAVAAETAATGVSPGAPSDEEIRRDLRELDRYYGRGGARGRGVTVADGEAQAAPGVPAAVQDVVAGGNAIARFPYRWGGGHGSFLDNAYDCSGSVSYALAAAGLLDAPLASGPLQGWGRKGPGKWITVYANPGHVYMVVGGVRFDTSGRDGRRGSRWQLAARSPRGFEARHFPGL